MKHLRLHKLTGSASLLVAFGSLQASAQSGTPPLSADQVSAALRGKICISRVGAEFTFTADGHYAYSGKLGFSHSGHYSLGDGTVTILLDSGLGRDFVISRRDDVLYIEQTAIRCEAPAPKDARFSSPQ